MKRYKISIIVLLLLCITVAYGGDRKNIEVYDSGEKTASGAPLYKHYTLLDIDECDDTGCLIGEISMEQWDGAEWIYQYISINGNKVCDMIKIWKPLVDPTYGTYYTIHKVL